MPLKIVHPRLGKTPYYYVRGTYLGIPIDRSTKTTERALAAKFLKLLKDEIEQRTYRSPSEPTFHDAVESYKAANGEDRFLVPLEKHFGRMAPAAITQQQIDEAAIKLYPKATRATRNRQVHTPISAILKLAGIERKIRRPRDSRGKKLLYWHTKESAFQIFAAAAKIDKEFELLLRFLCYTGLRLSEALGLTIKQLELDRNFCFVGLTKNGEPRGVHLPDHLVAAFRAHPRGLNRPGKKVFRWSKCGRIYALMRLVKKEAGQEFELGKFHIFRHTYGTWMTEYGGLDTQGLVETGAWKNEESARRYQHTVATKEAQQSDRLPVEKQWKARAAIGISNKIKRT